MLLGSGNATMSVVRPTFSEVKRNFSSNTQPAKHAWGHMGARGKNVVPKPRFVSRLNSNADDDQYGEEMPEPEAIAANNYISPR